MLMWPQLSLQHSYLFWWNPWVLFTSIGMVCLSISRFFGIEQAFLAPEIALGVILTQAVHFGMAYGHPSDRTGAIDELLFAFDTRFFGSECDVILGKLFAWSFPVKWFFVEIYNALPLAFVLAYLALPNSKRVRRQYCAMIALSAVVVFAMYTVCPGAGPRYLFHNDFPFSTKAIMEPHAVIFAEPVVLNTTPSGHLAWALLVFWCVRRHSTSRTARYLAGAFCALTAVSTMGTGEHYLIDLVLALPFAAGIWDMVMGRWKFALGYWLSVVVWSVALRMGWALDVPVPVVWVAMIATMAVPCLGRQDAARELAVGTAVAPEQSLA